MELSITRIYNDYCDIVYNGCEYKNCLIEKHATFVFIGLPAHWFCGEYCGANEEGPMIGIEQWEKLIKG